MGEYRLDLTEEFTRHMRGILACSHRGVFRGYANALARYDKDMPIGAASKFHDTFIIQRLTDSTWRTIPILD